MIYCSQECHRIVYVEFVNNVNADTIVHCLTVFMNCSTQDCVSMLMNCKLCLLFNSNFHAVAEGIFGVHMNLLIV